MKCLSCGAPLDMTKVSCPMCQTPVDADGDGVPDALAKMVEDKARRMIQADRDAEAARAREAARIASEAAASAALSADRERLERARAQLVETDAAPRPLWYMSVASALLLFAVSALGGGIIAPACIEPIALDRSIAAGELLCPSVCDGCRGPGRVFTWHESGGSYEGNVSTQLCHNPHVDIDQLTWMNVTGREDNDLKPYRLTLWTSVPIDFGILFASLLVVGPFWGGRIRRRSLDALHVALTEQIDALEARVREAPRDERGGPYRGRDDA
jgi:hypothetical protein